MPEITIEIARRAIASGRFNTRAGLPLQTSGTRLGGPLQAPPPPLTAQSKRMWKTQLSLWQIGLVERLERNLGRPLAPEDLVHIIWNIAAETLTVEGRLLEELRRESVMPSVFRSRYRGPGQRSGAFPK